MSFAGPDIRSVTSVRTSSTNLLRKKFRSRAAWRRATRIRTYAQSVRLIDRVVRGQPVGMRLPLCDNTLHAIRSCPQTKKISPGPVIPDSLGPGSSRSSLPV
jgi:hypothetical protein